MKKRSSFWLISGILLILGAVSTVLIKVNRANLQQPESHKRVNHMPPVLSKVKTLEVVRSSIIYPGTPAAGVEVEVKNNSDKDIVAIDLVSGDGAVTKNGLTDEENPIVVVKAHETTKLRMGFGEMTFGAPLVVSAVTYADGTEEGDEKSLRAMHLARKHDRAVMKAEKEKNAQNGVRKP